MSEFSRWEAEFGPVFHGFVAPLGRCDSTCARQWAPALLSDADQLRAAAKSLDRWSTEHPCPDQNVDMALKRVARSYRYAAQGVEAVARGSSATWLVVERELKGLHAMVAKVMTLLYDQAH